MAVRVVKERFVGRRAWVGGVSVRVDRVRRRRFMVDVGDC